jgi:hypothetical protein
MEIEFPNLHFRGESYSEANKNKLFIARFGIMGVSVSIEIRK